jgi:hypothetical protein
MKLYGYEFENEGTVQFQPISGVQFSDLNIDEYSVIPEGTHLIWEYSTDGGITWDSVVPAEHTFGIGLTGNNSLSAGIAKGCCAHLVIGAVGQ